MLHASCFERVINTLKSDVVKWLYYRDCKFIPMVQRGKVGFLCEGVVVVILGKWSDDILINKEQHLKQLRFYEIDV